MICLNEFMNWSLSDNILAYINKIFNEEDRIVLYFPHLRRYKEQIAFSTQYEKRLCHYLIT